MFTYQTNEINVVPTVHCHRNASDKPPNMRYKNLNSKIHCNNFVCALEFATSFATMKFTKLFPFGVVLFGWFLVLIYPQDLSFETKKFQMFFFQLLFVKYIASVSKGRRTVPQLAYKFISQFAEKATMNIRNSAIAVYQGYITAGMRKVSNSEQN